jgi:hypothetical protein
MNTAHWKTKNEGVQNFVSFVNDRYSSDYLLSYVIFIKQSKNFKSK